jgi:LytS/YehU family sensor histidine kinase
LVRVPPLILQPLVEKAVRHGIATRLEGGTISITATVAGSRAFVVIANPYDADGRRRGTGFGLEIVRRRLAATFGDRAALATETADGQYRVSVTMPVEERSE